MITLVALDTLVRALPVPWFLLLGVELVRGVHQRRQILPAARPGQLIRRRVRISFVRRAVRVTQPVRRVGTFVQREIRSFIRRD